MYGPDSDSTTRFIAGPFGCLIPRFQPRYSYVYLLHFKQKYHHAGHYLGVAHDLEQRLARHREGRGARLMEVISSVGIDFEVSRLWRFESWIEAQAWERKLKKWQMGPRLCPLCQGKPIDGLTMLHNGHYPFDLFPGQGKRQPMNRVVVFAQELPF